MLPWLGEDCPKGAGGFAEWCPAEGSVSCTGTRNAQGQCPSPPGKITPDPFINQLHGGAQVLLFLTPVGLEAAEDKGGEELTFPLVLNHSAVASAPNAQVGANISPSCLSSEFCSLQGLLRMERDRDTSHQHLTSMLMTLLRDSPCQAQHWGDRDIVSSHCCNPNTKEWRQCQQTCR